MSLGWGMVNFWHEGLGTDSNLSLRKIGFTFRYSLQSRRMVVLAELAGAACSELSCRVRCPVLRTSPLLLVSLVGPLLGQSCWSAAT